MSGDASLFFRRYGKSYQSVDSDFDAMVFNDIGFRRNRRRRIPAEGPVQAETKQLLLDRLRFEYSLGPALRVSLYRSTESA